MGGGGSVPSHAAFFLQSGAGRRAPQADGGGPSPASALGSPGRDFPASAGPGSRGLSSWNKERSLRHGVGVQNRFWLAFLPMLSSLSFSSKMPGRFLILPSAKQTLGICTRGRRVQAGAVGRACGRTPRLAGPGTVPPAQASRRQIRKGPIKPQPQPGPVNELKTPACAP